MILFQENGYNKRRDIQKGSLDRFLFGAELEFLKILFSTQNTSNVNIECAAKSTRLYSLYDQPLVAQIYLTFHLYIYIFYCFHMNLFLIDYAFGNCVICGYSFLRATSGVSLYRSNNGGKMLLQLLIVIG